MPNAKDITLETTRLRCLVQGGSGSGKTTLIGTFREAGPVYVYDFDAGMTTLRGMDVEYDIYNDDIKNGVLVTSGWVKMQAHLRQMEQDCPYRTVAFDSTTLMSESAMSEICKQNRRSRPELQDWQVVYNWVRDLMNQVKSLPCNVIFTCHEETEKDELTGRIITKPMIIGNAIPRRAPIFFDEHYRLAVDVDRKGNVRHMLYTQATERFEAKSRLGLPPVIEDPSYTKIMALLKETKAAGGQQHPRE